MLVAAASTRVSLAQSPHAARSPEFTREVQGTVTRAVGTGGRPLAGAWVMLHRVGTDGAGAIDSMRTQSGGQFRFRYPVSGDSSALYFVSSRFAGIAYFTPPLRRPLVRGEEADLVLYDTTSAPVPIHVRGRHIVVMAPDSMRERSVVEAYELSNDSSVTRVAGDSERPTFETVLPDGARDAHATNGEVPAEGVSFTEGTLRVFAPLAPGLKQLSFTYRLPSQDTRIAMVAVDPVTVLEVLVEGAQGTATGAGLSETDPAVLDGRRFRRFLSHDTRANAVLSILVPAARVPIRTLIAVIMTGLGATMLLALARSFARRGLPTTRSGAQGDPRALAAQMTALDTSFASLDAPTAEQRADHYEARAHLAARLARAKDLQ